MTAVDDARAQYGASVAAMTSSAGADLGTSLVERVCDSSESESEESVADSTEQSAFSLNVDANEFVPTSSHALNVNAIVFTPFGEL